MNLILFNQKELINLDSVESVRVGNNLCIVLLHSGRELEFKGESADYMTRLFLEKTTQAACQTLYNAYRITFQQIPDVFRKHIIRLPKDRE